MPELLQADPQLQQDKKANAPIQQQQADLVNKIGARGDLLAAFDDFMSVSQTPFLFSGQMRDDNPATEAKSAGNFVQAIQNEITAEKSADPIIDLPSVTEVLTRMGATSCGGCHQFSSVPPQPIGATSDGKPILWPSSLGFVQIDEGSTLSPLLTNFFLADRCENMNKIFFSAPPPPPPVGAPVTIVGTAPAKVLLQVSVGLPTLNQSAKSALQGAISQVIDLDRKVDRARPGALGDLRHPD